MWSFTYFVGLPHVTPRSPLATPPKLQVPFPGALSRPRSGFEPWLDTSTPDPDTIPTLSRHYPDTSTLRHQCQPTLGPTLRHQCQASVKPSRQWTSSTGVKQCQGCQDKTDTPTLDTPTLRHPSTLRHATPLPYTLYKSNSKDAQDTTQEQKTLKQIRRSEQVAEQPAAARVKSGL